MNTLQRLGLFALLTIGVATQLVCATTPEHLQVNGIPTPLGLDATNANSLRFGWRVTQGTQTAYQIQLSNGWDSGKVTSSQQYAIPYKGPALTAKTAYTWKVKLWVDGTETAWTEAGFETAILDPRRDWQGAWVSSGETGGQKRVSFFGYKDHIKTDADTSLITDYRVTQIMTTRQGLTRSGECEKMRKLSTAGWRVGSCNPNTKKDKQGDSFLSKRIRHSVRFAH